jgi:hypothetical protein
MDYVKQLYVLIKPYLVPKIIGWGAKVLAGVFATLGMLPDVQNQFLSSTTELLLSGAFFLIGLAVSAITNKKAVEATPPA